LLDELNEMEAEAMEAENFDMGMMSACLPMAGA